MEEPTYLPVESVVCVNPDSTRAESIRNLDGSVEVSGVDSGGQAV